MTAYARYGRYGPVCHSVRPVAGMENSLCTGGLVTGLSAQSVQNVNDCSGVIDEEQCTTGGARTVYGGVGCRCTYSSGHVLGLVLVLYSDKYSDWSSYWSWYWSLYWSWYWSLYWAWYCTGSGTGPGTVLGLGLVLYWVWYCTGLGHVLGLYWSWSCTGLGHVLGLYWSCTGTVLYWSVLY